MSHDIEALMLGVFRQLSENDRLAFIAGLEADNVADKKLAFAKVSPDGLLRIIEFGSALARINIQPLVAAALNKDK